MHNPSELEFPGTCEDKGYAYVHFVLVDVNPDVEKQKIIGKYLVWSIILTSREKRVHYLLVKSSECNDVTDSWLDDKLALAGF